MILIHVTYVLEKSYLFDAYVLEIFSIIEVKAQKGKFTTNLIYRFALRCGNDSLIVIHFDSVQCLPAQFRPCYALSH